jgi:hypothetical protein
VRRAAGDLGTPAVGLAGGPAVEPAAAAGAQVAAFDHGHQVRVRPGGGFLGAWNQYGATVGAIAQGKAGWSLMPLLTGSQGAGGAMALYAAGLVLSYSVAFAATWTLAGRSIIAALTQRPSGPSGSFEPSELPEPSEPSASENPGEPSESARTS